jgi:hypothetical protein
MRKITVPTKTQQPDAPRPPQPQDRPRPRLGLRYGANTDAHARP